MTTEKQNAPTSPNINPSPVKLKNLPKKPYRGTRDFFPQEKRLQDYLFNQMKITAEKFAYESYNGPLLEEVDLYKAKSGEELINDQIYSFTDRGERFVAIRPEMTPTLARMVAQVHQEYTKPLRWYSIPNLMRYENPQRGRLREHWQLNCDIFGAISPYGEMEILQVIIELLHSYGANSNHFEILINDKKIVQGLFNEVMHLEADRAYKLIKILDRSKKLKPEELQHQLNQLSLTAIQQEQFTDYLALAHFKDLEVFCAKYNLQNAAKDILLLCQQMPDADLYLKYDPVIVRGLDYYTGIVFEVFDKNPENRRALCGGGAYGNLLEIFNEKPLPGVGFGMGDVTLKDFLTTHNLIPAGIEKPRVDFLISFQVQDSQHTQSSLNYILKLAQELRSNHYSTLIQYQPLKIQKAFDLAEKRGARSVLFFGEEELANQNFSAKNLQSGTHQQFKIFDIASDSFRSWFHLKK